MFLLRNMGGAVTLALLTLAPPASPAPGQDVVAQAEKLYQRTDYERAISLLEAEKEKTPAAWFLLGQCYYGVADFGKAAAALEKAVAGDPRNATYFNWLGKAMGRRAETASLFLAPGLARKARENFERAVELDPTNREAVSDLFEFYLEAPGFLGGGREKAAALAEKMNRLDPAQYHYLQARLAEKAGRLDVVEQNLRAAVEAAPRQVGRILDLARFLARRGRLKESEQLFAQAETLSPGSPRVKFAKAEAYVKANRNLEQARQLLEEYLASPLTPDDPPRQEAERLLKAASKG